MGRRPKVTWERLRAAIRAGSGTGHGNDYKPFLEIKRWNASPISTQVRKAVPPYSRACHFFCQSEWFLALIFSWLGALVREQFPAWPWRHPHPLAGLQPDLDAQLPWSAGMEDVCRSAGIKHGTFPGTDIPYIWTIDLALTIPWTESDIPACCLVSIKPIESERYLYVDPLDRGPEKLEGERRYARSLGIPYIVADRAKYPGDLLGQLEFLAGAAALPKGSRRWTILQRFLDTHGHELQDHPPLEWILRLEFDFDATRHEADYLIQHCIWHQIIDLDVSRFMDLSKRPIPGGRRLRDKLRETIWEEMQ